MLDVYLFETTQNVEQLEAAIFDSEKSSGYSIEMINEIFRIMHTIKGSSAMMLFNNISTLAHRLEDVFFFLREQKDFEYDYEVL
jgi:Chemotaxis protein histidine kinase and related kinases